MTLPLYLFSGEQDADCTFRPSLKVTQIGRNFSMAAYAIAVARELTHALKGLVGKEWDE